MIVVSSSAPSLRRTHLSMVIGLAVVLLQVIFVLGGAGPARAATALYPDLKTLPPRDLRYATATISGSTHQVLRFSNTVTDVGVGRLDMIGVIDPDTMSGPAQQRVYDDAGNYTTYDAGQFYWHDVHKHFHYENWGRYELWTKADYDKWLSTGRSIGQAKKVGTKTTSCIMDEEFISELPGTPYPARYGSGGCNLQPDNTLHEGLSPGWGDTYDYYRDEQWIDLGSTRLADGTYVLRSVTDPTNLIYESPGKADTSKESQEDNEATTTFQVSGGVILDGTAPTGTITINSTAPSTDDATVTVSAIGRDDVSGVDAFRLSNDGVTWKRFTYTPNSSNPTNVTWSLTDPAYGGTSPTGSKKVFAQFHDASGKWGTTVSDTIEYGSPPPPPPPPTDGYAGVVAADGPVGYWRLGETSGTTAADAVGTHAGQYIGGPVLGQPSLVATESDPSVGMTGSSAVRIPDAPDLRLGSPLSLEAWILPDSLAGSGAWATIVTKPESYSLQFNGQQLELTIIQNGTRKRLKAPVGTIAVGRTYHVVGTYDGSIERLFVNGNQVASGGLVGPATATTRPLMIGSWDGTKEFFAGRIDDVAVYNKALSGTQVGNHYDAATGGPVQTTNPVTVALTGTGKGAVSSSPVGINCPTTCTADFPSGTAVTLTATPASGSTFAGWTDGACAGTTPSCTFNAYAATSATASFASASTTGYAATVAGDGPVGYWRLGEASGTTAADVNGTHPGTYVNGPALGQLSLLNSDANTSVSFDGVNDHVRVPDAPDLRLGSVFSLEAWIRPTALPATGAWATIVTKPEAYSLQFNGQRLELTVIQNGTRKRLLAPTGAVTTGHTYHVVGTYDGATQCLYVNGNLVASGGLVGPATATTSPLRIGSWSGTKEFFTGWIDDVAVYNKALSGTQVSSHYAAGNGVT